MLRGRSEMLPCRHVSHMTGCKHCVRYRTDPRYRELVEHGLSGMVLPLPECIHLGEALPLVAQPRDCKGCTDKLRDCDLHGCCAVRPNKNTDVRSCETCDDHAQLFDPVTKRHLLFHVYPASGNGVWQRRIGQIRDRIQLFNGRRIVAVVTDNGKRGFDPTGRDVIGCDPPEEVESALSGCACEFIHVANDPNMREVSTFEPLFSRVADCCEPDEVTLYAHAKGVTRPTTDPSQMWADMLFTGYCDYWPVVESILEAKPLAGMFRKLGRPWQESASQWHYSSSWFWFRNAELFRRDWKRIDKFWSGIEPYPSLHFRANQAGVIFGDGVVGELELFKEETWRRLLPEWAKWRKENGARMTRWD